MGKMSSLLFRVTWKIFGVSGRIVIVSVVARGEQRRGRNNVAVIVTIRRHNGAVFISQARVRLIFISFSFFFSLTPSALNNVTKRTWFKLIGQRAKETKLKINIRAFFVYFSFTANLCEFESETPNCFFFPSSAT